MSPNNRTRMLALVGPLKGERHATHTANHPLHPDQMLPVADVVLLVSDDGHNAMVFRYTAHGEFAGDTFHETVAEAQYEAENEYEDALLPWEEVPDEVSDAHAFAVRYARERLNDRSDGN